MFRQRERREREREKNITVWFPLERPPQGTWPTTQARALTGNRTREPSVHRRVLDPLSHTNPSSNYYFKNVIFHPGSVD